MQDSPPPTLTVAALYAERDERRRREREAEEQLTRKREEELAQFKRRLDEFKLTDERVSAVFERKRRSPRNPSGWPHCLRAPTRSTTTGRPI